MSEQITIILKKELEDQMKDREHDAETLRNILKEELQYYILNFIYHHPKYNKWIMYGGSALRIIHGLNRMSVDLDFEISHPVTEKFLEELEKEIKEHFLNTYGSRTDFITIKIISKRGLLLKFHLGEELSFGHPSKQVHVKIDLNHFVAPKAVTERILINRNQLSFGILTYNMATLMASKIAAILLRGTRGVGEAVYEEKGRDIYDLLWYMNKKVIPDFNYLSAKGIDIKDPKTLFNELTIKMSKVNNKNLEQDLYPLFIIKEYIRNWLENWRESYFQLLEGYKINTVTTLAEIQIHQHFRNDSFSFTYTYNTEDGKSVMIRYLITDYWIDFEEGNLPIEVDKKLEDKIKFSSDGWSSREAPKDKLKQYATLFYQKTEKYFEKTNKVMIGNRIATKLIRMTANNLNPKEEIVLNKSALMYCDLDDLLK